MNTNNQILLAINPVTPTTNVIARQAHALLVAFLFTLSMILVSWGTVYAADPIPPVNNAVKWHPGHYYTILSSGKENSYSKVDPAVKTIID